MTPRLQNAKKEITQEKWKVPSPQRKSYSDTQLQIRKEIPKEANSLTHSGFKMEIFERW